MHAACTARVASAQGPPVTPTKFSMTDTVDLFIRKVWLLIAFKILEFMNLVLVFSITNISAVLVYYTLEL
jgi:hypothetical protein